MKLTVKLLLLLLPLAALAACSETKEEGEYDNWEQRNVEYVNSLVPDYPVMGGTLRPETAPAGSKFRIPSFKLDPGLREYDPSDYVYCEVLESGTGECCALYSDSVVMHYRGRLIPSMNYPEGFVFDQSYKFEKPDPAVNIPQSASVKGLVAGFSTALLYMRTGSVWRVTIPGALGYRDMKMNQVPEYSTLVFDIYLVDIKKQ